MAHYETDGLCVSEGGKLICSFHNISMRTRERLIQLVVDALNLQEQFYMDCPVEATLQSEEFGHEFFDQDDYLSALAFVARLTAKVRARQGEEPKSIRQGSRARQPARIARVVGIIAEGNA